LGGRLRSLSAAWGQSSRQGIEDPIQLSIEPAKPRFISPMISVRSCSKANSMYFRCWTVHDFIEALQAVKGNRRRFPSDFMFR